MFGRVVFFTFIVVGMALIVLGWLAVRGKRRARMTFIERPLIELLALKNQRQVSLVLGRLRLVYGLFFALVGIWGLKH